MTTDESAGASWFDWYNEVCGDLSTRRVGIELGRDSGYVERNLKIIPPTVDAVLLFAHAFERNPVEALIRAGVLTPGEVLSAAMALDMDTSSVPELVDLIGSATDTLRLRVQAQEKPGAGQGDSAVTSVTPGTTDTSQNLSVGSRKDGENRRKGRDRRNTAEEVRRGFLR
ncbi:hypothetical protein [Nocardia sp. CS682]|uniref:hypothetical protein n=1 Tax=Nocardia sp. CS682 TaxID=1047172 RepID=UPI0010755FF2|nr:hypothetical protein [Nocardia sp. CS682]QBS43830.1 hypothetical protein DMB37_30780 [Nocardia sp. CS682]